MTPKQIMDDLEQDARDKQYKLNKAQAEIASLKDKLAQRNQIIQEKSNELCKLINIRNQLAEANEKLTRRNTQISDLSARLAKAKEQEADLRGKKKEVTKMFNEALRTACPSDCSKCEWSQYCDTATNSG